MSEIEAFLAEFDREAVTTRKLMERIPADKLDWKPHERSSTLGKLAMHIAALPGRLAMATTKDDFSFTGPAPQAPNGAPAPGYTLAAVLEAFDKGTGQVHEALDSLTNEKLDERWTAKFGEKTVMDMPRRAVIRTMLLNHWYHHRGQLSVYLRMLDVPLPSIYGPSADENPFV